MAQARANERERWEEKRRAIEKENDPTQNRAYSAAQIALARENEKKAWEEKQKDKKTLSRKVFDFLFGWIDKYMNWLKEREEETDISIEPGPKEFEDGGLSNCIIPPGIQDSDPEKIYEAFKGAPSQEFEAPIQEYIANAFLGYYPEQKVYGGEEHPPVEATGTPPVQIAEDTFVSANKVVIHAELVFTMYIQEGDTITLHIAEQSSSGNWRSVEQVGEIKELPSDCD